MRTPRPRGRRPGVSPAPAARAASCRPASSASPPAPASRHPVTCATGDGRTAERVRHGLHFRREAGTGAVGRAHPSRPVGRLPTAVRACRGRAVCGWRVPGGGSGSCPPVAVRGGDRPRWYGRAAGWVWSAGGESRRGSPRAPRWPRAAWVGGRGRRRRLGHRGGRPLRRPLRRPTRGGQSRDSSSTRSSSPSEPCDSAAMCQAFRSNASPCRSRAFSRPSSHARSPSL